MIQRAVLLLALAAAPGPVHAQPAGPNMLVIFGDDIGQTNVSAYSMGVMGYRTPNIDRIAREGMIFTDYYAEQSCTAGRSTFVTGQASFRTGLSKVGVPGATVGLQKNVYHLYAQEEPEQRTYPRDPKFAEMFGPRGVIRSRATDRDDSTVEPRWGRVGKQTIVDTGPLTRKRMETIDDETSDAAVDYIRQQATFTEFPPRQRAATFSVDQAVEKMKQNLGSQ